MSVLIKGMEMPKSCSDCRLMADGWCYSVGLEQREKISTVKRPTWCPLVPVPPHGDLIDVEIFIATQREMYCENCERRKGRKNGKMRFVYDVGDAPCRACDIRDVLDALEDTPTIIPAEEGE